MSMGWADIMSRLQPVRDVLPGLARHQACRYPRMQDTTKGIGKKEFLTLATHSEDCGRVKM